MKPFRLLVAVILLTLVGSTGVFHRSTRAQALPSAQAGSGMRTPLTAQMLDRTVFTVWVEGHETGIGLPPRGPEHVIWTQNSAPEWNGVDFGETKTAGARALRIGFLEPVAVGTVVVRGGGQLSVLRAGAAYPGRLSVEADWTPAQHLSGTTVGSGEVGRETYALWTLPPGTKTRALRFTHTPAPTDKTYAGWLGGVYLLTDRLANIAPQAEAVTLSNPDAAPRINDSDNNRLWDAWDNMAREGKSLTDRTAPISKAAPETVTLIWPRPMTLQGLCALWAGFGAAEAQAYIGSGDPRRASEAEWKTLHDYPDIQAQYPRSLGVNWLDFGQTVTTRAIRLRITKPTTENHDHLRGSTREGHRVWLGELLAVQPLGVAPLATAILPQIPRPETHPPIPIPITLPNPGYVTLVIEDAQGRRVRNLLSAVYFAKAGPQTVWWDGMDDLGRDTEAARHGVYSTPGQFVAPGAYRVRGLIRPEIDLRYEFSPYNAGNPAWETADHTGGWLTNHTPPGCTLFVPADADMGQRPLVFIGSYVAEGGDGLAWVDLDGHKLGGRGWIGGTWTGAQYLAAAKPNASGVTNVYAAAAWETDTDHDKGEIRLTRVTLTSDHPVLKYVFTPDRKHDPNVVREHEWGGELGGLAAHEDVLAFSLTRQNKIVLVSAKSGKVLRELTVESPRGLVFDRDGGFWSLSGKRLLHWEAGLLPALGKEPLPVQIPEPKVVVAEGLEDPVGLTLDAGGNLYVSDQGNSQQVKVFRSNGTLWRTIGHPGAPHAGAYDPEHMNHPKGMTIDERNQLWVAEEDFQPKRVSVWSLDGQLLHAFYGPSQYGGGGTLDPKDRSRFYYNGMEFHLDWQQGTSRLVDVFHRPGKGDLLPPDGYGNNGMPETPLYVHGAQYMTNAYNSNPTNGASIAMVWKMQEGRARPVAALGRANDWSLLKGEAFRGRWPQGVDPKGDVWQNQTLFVWSDRNDDGQMQPEEVTMRRADVGGVTVMPDLAIMEARVGGSAMRYAPVGFTALGTPFYDLEKGQAVAADVQGPVSSGGDQALVSPDGWIVLTNAPKPFSAYGIGGVKNGKALWTYPSLWPGLHASHESAAPDRPGELVGTTRLLGPAITPMHGEAGALWAINGNMGCIYLFTSDGLFVAQLFQDVRQGQTWSMPAGVRDMKLNDLTLHDENFWPSITQTASDGKVYLVDGGRSSLVRVDGLEGIRRLPSTTVHVSADDLKRAQQAFLQAEAVRQQAAGPHRLLVALRSEPPVVDGKLDDWVGTEWVTVDKRGVSAFFDSNSKPYDVKAAVRVAGDRLYAAYQTGDKDLLRNSGETPNALFKTGGALDLMIGADPHADPQRQHAVAGDIRLLVTLVKGKPRALLYRAVVSGTKEPVAFRSPSRGITIDQVEDVSAQVQLAGDNTGNFELSIPLTTLGWKPQSGQKLRGDIGLLRGNGFQTLQRVYWSNKATGITADVPSEAELTPQLWGEWQVVNTP